MLDAMSSRVSRHLHTPRQSLPIAACGRDALLLLMVSTTLPSVMLYLGMHCQEDIHVYREYPATVKDEIVRTKTQEILIWFGTDG
jgi:hypothetical protein